MKLKITLLAFLLALLGTAYGQNRKGNFRLLPGNTLHKIYVSYNPPADGTALNEMPGFSRLVQQYSITTQKAISIPEAKMLQLEALALKNTGSAASVAKLRTIYELEIADPANERVLQLAKALEELDYIGYCSLMPATPIRPPFDIAPITPLFEGLQNYMSPMAVNMQHAWAMGLNGQGIYLRDIEYGFNILHEELNDINVYVGPGMTISNQVTTDFAEHGTAVFGVMVANKGGYGISGMAYGAEEMVLFPEYQLSGYNRVNAVTQAITNSSEGDVIVYEMQTFGPSDQYCPAEYDNVIWDLTRAAADAGIVIVAAAGNGNQNLDTPPYIPYMSRGDSGAIIVGAGTNDETRERLSFSTCGTRVDVQGWGQGVFTSGYGDALQVGGDFNQAYTNFSGTSSATPIVASCVAVLQSYYHSLTGEYLTGLQMRDLLINTGKPQGPVAAGNIGPLPDMEAAIAEIANMLGAPTHEKASFSVYPNPVQDRLTVNAEGFAGSVKAEVYNSLGQLVNAVDVSAAGREIDFSGMSGGVYFVKVSDGDISLTKRVIKK